MGNRIYDKGRITLYLENYGYESMTELSYICKLSIGFLNTLDRNPMANMKLQTIHDIYEATKKFKGEENALTPDMYLDWWFFHSNNNLPLHIKEGNK